MAISPLHLTHKLQKKLKIQYKQVKITETAADVKIGFLKNFAIFIGKHLCWSLFSVRLQHRRLLVNIGKFLRTPFFYRPPLVATSKIMFYLVYI